MKIQGYVERIEVENNSLLNKTTFYFLIHREGIMDVFGSVEWNRNQNMNEFQATALHSSCNQEIILPIP